MSKPTKNPLKTFQETFSKLPLAYRTILMPFAACIADLHKRVTELEKAMSAAKTADQTSNQTKETH